MHTRRLYSSPDFQLLEIGGGRRGVPRRKWFESLSVYVIDTQFRCSSCPGDLCPDFLVGGGGRGYAEKCLSAYECRGRVDAPPMMDKVDEARRECQLLVPVKKNIGVRKELSTTY